MKLIDCNCHFGKTVNYDPGAFYEKHDLLLKMELFNIEKALVYHSQARDYSPLEGNKLLLEEINENSNLLPVFVVIPNHTGEFMDITEIDKRVKAVRLFPSMNRQNFSLMDYSSKEIYDFCATSNLPVMIDIDETSWDMVDMILSNHYNLKLIISNTGYRADRYIYPLMKKHQNLYIETSRYSGHQAIENFIDHFGSEKILFGSGMPVYSGGGGAYYIEHLMISDRDRENIAYSNMSRLIDEVSL
ncbi:MAG: amidohydrolase family protein [Clostridia bacterium]|nr:amidohydrolase family protein [Clostridia bacterium]